jgi:bla regulator protein BlaR1
MKKLKLVILFIILINLEYSYGQNTKVDDVKRSKSQSIANENNPLVVINGIEFENYSAILNKISANDIEKLEVKKSNTAINAYGEKAKNGAIIIHLKNKKITTVEQLNKEYNFRQ